MQLTPENKIRANQIISNYIKRASKGDNYAKMKLRNIGVTEDYVYGYDEGECKVTDK